MGSMSRVVVKNDCGAELEILFRQLLQPVPAGWKPGMHWQVEAYEYGLEQPPIGFCWIVDDGSVLPPDRQHEAYPPIVEFVRVFHTHLRCGVATALLDAARQRWPDLELTRDTSPEGKAFLAAYLAHVEKQGTEGATFADRNRHLFSSGNARSNDQTESG